MAEIEAGQTGLGDHRVGLKEQVGAMGEVLFQGVVDRADDRRGLLNCNKP